MSHHAIVDSNIVAQYSLHVMTVMNEAVLAAKTE